MPESLLKAPEIHYADNHPSSYKDFKTFLDFTFKKIVNNKQFENASLENGLAGDLLFLLYYHQYKSDEVVEKKAIEFASDIYRLFKRNKINPDIHDYFGGIIGIITAFETVKKHQLLDTDVAQVFQKIDFSVHNHLLYKKESNLSLSDGLAGKGLFMLSRTRKAEGFKTGKELRPVEALIRFVDKVEDAFERGEREYSGKSYLDDLAVAAIVLTKIWSQKIYPEITERLLDRIWGFFKDVLADKQREWDSVTRINILYASWKIAHAFPEKEKNMKTLYGIDLLTTSIIKEGNAKWSFKQLRLIQQLNELQWATGDEKIKKCNSALLYQMIERYANNSRENVSGLLGLSGLGLLVLSFISEACLSWDEVIGLS